MAQPAIWLMAKTTRLWRAQRPFGGVLVVGLAWLTVGPPLHAWATTAGTTLGVTAIVAPQLLVDGQGVVGNELAAGAAIPADGIPFRIRVRSNASWRWSVRVAAVSGLRTPLRCSYACRAIQVFGGAPGGAGQIELGPADANIPGAPLPRGEVVLEGRVLAPPAAKSDAAWNVTLVWTVTQVEVSAGRPLTWTTTARVHSGTATALPVPTAR